MRNKKRSVQQEQLQYYEPQTGWMSKRGKALYLRLQQALEAGGSAAITHTEESEMEEEGEEEEEDQEMNLIEDDEVEEENVQTARVNEESVDPFQESHSSTSLNRGGGGGGNQLRCLLLNELASRLGFPISMLGQYDEEGDVFM